MQITKIYTVYLRFKDTHLIDTSDDIMRPVIRAKALTLLSRYEGYLESSGDRLI